MKTKLLLVGSSGFLGRALYQQFSQTFEVIPTHTTNKVFENSESYNFFKDDIRVLLDKHSPDTVVMVAAVEKDPEETYSDRNYQARVRQFVKACQSRYVVYISSDALFDGKKGNYSETDLPSPLQPTDATYYILKHSYKHRLKIISLFARVIFMATLGVFSILAWKMPEHVWRRAKFSPILMTCTRAHSRSTKLLTT
jgi:dTDP-4-dehydrorhamnose reductase